MNACAEYKRWLENVDDDALLKEMQNLSDTEIDDRFGAYLAFGTGGLRGVLGAGTNRMNKYVVRRASLGIAHTIENKQAGVVIGHDSRICSREFAVEAALVYAAAGVKVYLFDALRPTPMVSFAIRYLHAAAGVVITASHNPKEYNGYKAYGADGGQLPPEAADRALAAMEGIDPFAVPVLSEAQAREAGLLVTLGEDIDKPYIEHVLSLRPSTRGLCRDLRIVYTPLHGSGNKPVRRALKEAGFTNVFVVKEQELPDGNFPTVRTPNPEDPNAFACAIRLGDETGADLLVATDPDCDRVGVMARRNGKWQALTGNQVGCLLLEYLLNAKTPKPGAYAVKTIVTTRMADAIGKAHGIDVYNVLTGFKFIGETIQKKLDEGNDGFVLGFEESYGYLTGGYVRDKDAVIASTLICEMAAQYKSEGKTLADALEALFQKYGYYKEGTINVMMKGADGLRLRNEKMNSLRANAPAAIGGLRVENVVDYKNGARGLPPSNVLLYEMEDGAWLCVRPSGTEPKLKLYFGVRGSTAEEAQALADGMMQDAQKIMGE
ncbi:MAG TPA: phospho-sugar mutase [Candidatus Alectryocaccomicrobium excrementavium]|uniref:Phosphoglucomutase n=1 Tax=Candidatus Alectryocaccomicrobium excrementavium TaxID=2840668 RepID=A0A9D1K4Z3_9FIRM|nr:phospho-sugar mutase [Candidatus Alectryocaccomicrobium excrementavium]